MHIKKNDTVAIITGDDAGRSGRVLQVLPQKNKVLVEGINKVYRHMKPSRRNPQGGRLAKEMPVDISNVLLVCPTCRRGVRIGNRPHDDGSKERYCKKCGTGLGLICKARGQAAGRV